jgi:spermidine synthase
MQTQPSIPYWKYLYSYLRPIIIEETESELNPYLAVAIEKGRLQLLSGNAIYSWDDLYDNFYIAFGKLNIQQRAPRTALILGGGLGSIPFMLEKKLGVKNCDFTIVEYDEEVNYLASKYTLPRLQSHIELITADATVFVEVHEETYDLICVDLFIDDRVPVHVARIDFLEACKERLAPGGILLFNRLYKEALDRAASNAYFERVFKVAFKDGDNIITDGNMVCVGNYEL